MHHPAEQDGKQGEEDPHADALEKGDGGKVGHPWREKAVGGTPQSWATHRPIMAERTQGTMAA